MQQFVKLDPPWRWFSKAPAYWPGVMWKVLEDEKKEMFPFAAMWASHAINNGMPARMAFRTIGSHIYLTLRRGNVNIELN